MESNQFDPKFGIGAVARITGIAPDTLRIWERRYRVAAPERGQGSRRLYDRKDITRLTLIKQLVDQGNSISTVAGLSEGELREKLQVHQGVDKPLLGKGGGHSLKIMVYGDALPLLWRNQPREMFGVKLVSAHTNLVEFERDAVAERPDALVVEFPSVQRDTVAEIQNLLRRTGIGRCIVVYGFGTKDAIRALSKGQVEMIRAPVDLADIARACFHSIPNMPMDVTHPIISGGAIEAPPRRFDNNSLSIIANCSAVVECECPQHLVDLVYKLHAFEIYSGECESRDTKDAALHAYLYKITAQARAMMESALEKVVETEGIDLSENANN